jgi:hypothetical protein
MFVRWHRNDPSIGRTVNVHHGKEIGMEQRVLITAGASGIGREMARAFAANGAKVFVCDIDAAGLAALAAANLVAQGVSAVAFGFSLKPDRREADCWPAAPTVRTSPGRNAVAPTDPWSPLSVSQHWPRAGGRRPGRFP